jgi:hypothetical protein
MIQTGRLKIEMIKASVTFFSPKEILSRASLKRAIVGPRLMDRSKARKFGPN